MIKNASPFLAAAVLLGLSGFSQAELSANIALSSDYMWRGVSQTQRDPAISGGLDYSHESGWFVGAWASNVDFGAGDEYELDLYGGYANEVDGFGYSLMLNRYMYPDSDDADFTELMLGLSYGLFSGGVNYTVDSEVSGPGVFVDEDLYYYGSVAFELSSNWGLSATVGYYDFADDGEAGVGDVSYGHYQLDLSRDVGEYGALNFSLSQADDESGDDNLLALVSWSKSFSLN